ncbi:tetratricopeptide repeat protein [Actinoplanes sp. NPDC051851]|uniref:tetratricopeptide repeat protein n=1 Tax=Actinoplanes sp. NPDC051851 TaxID=3154753 RepID=UPI0034402795
MALSVDHASGATDTLPQRLAAARLAYLAGDDQPVERLHADLSDLSEGTAPDLAAVIGSAITLAGLARCRRTGIDDADHWIRAVEAFDRAGPGVSGRRDHVTEFGCALLLSGDVTRAEPVLRRTLTLGVATSDCRRCFALALDRHGEQHRARRVIEDAARLFPHDWQIGEAAAHLVELRSEDSDAIAAAWARAGAVLTEMGLPERAIAAYTRALGHARDHDGLLLALARSHLAAAHIDETLDVMHRLIRMEARLTPDLVPALVDFGGVLLDYRPEVVEDWLYLATQLIREAVDREPDHGMAQALLGEAYRLRDEPVLAQDTLDLALGLDPTNAYAWGRRGLVRKSDGRLDDAIADLDQAVDLAPQSAWIRHEAAIAYYSRAELASGPSLIADSQQALEHVDEAVKLNPDGAPGWRLRGYICWLLANSDPPALTESARSLRRAHELNPGEPLIAHELSKVLYRLGEYDEGLEMAVQAAGALPDVPEVLLIRGRILTSLNRAAEALPDLESAVAGQPDNTEAHAALAEGYRMLSRFEEALAEFDRVLDENPDDAWSLSNRGAVLMGLDRPEPAVRDLRHALELAPGDSWALSWLRDGLARTATPEAMATEIAAHAARYPHDQAIQEVYAGVLNATSRYEEAVDVAERSLSTNPDHAGLLRILGWAYFSMGREEQAIEYVQQAVAVSTDTVALADLAWVQSRCDRVTDALATLERALTNGPDGALYRLRSEILAEVADWPGSVEAARAAIEADPTDADAHRVLGWALEQMPECSEQALSAYREACRLEEREASTERGVADVLWVLGRRQEAESGYEAVLEHLRGLARTDPVQDHEIGWCLYRLGRHPEANDALLRALSAIPDRAIALFDIGLNWLAAGESQRAADAYTKGFEVIAGRHLGRFRGILAVGARDIRNAIIGGQMRETDQVRELIERLDTAAIAYPVDPPATPGRRQPASATERG